MGLDSGIDYNCFDSIISDMITKINKINDEYILETLKRYELATGDKQVYDMLNDRYPNLYIRYSEYLDDKEHKLYLIEKNSLKDWVQPITLVYEEPKFDFNPLDCSCKGYCRVSLEAGGKRI